MATTTEKPRVVRIPTQADLESALATPFQEFAGPALAIAMDVQRLSKRDDMDAEYVAGFEWPERPNTFEDIGRIYCWLRRVRSYIAETEGYLATVEEHLDALETFTPEHGNDAFRARIAQVDRLEREGD